MRFRLAYLLLSFGLVSTTVASPLLPISGSSKIQYPRGVAELTILFRQEGVSKPPSIQQAARASANDLIQLAKTELKLAGTVKSRFPFPFKSAKTI
ncbi:hypothetical protein GYMLUDRAFT_242339 [Collybiopsis luxurians FD-317 M1]|uniref:DUF541 domain-containing protein n=1 Tax=Collybiopsis luxurians FD-317 M1 TaxID=944289 RepID=A0A0D0CIY9_9AGAR|nr:hypothetical protein GYMLUDRAFT_242339 [Collybiopsis luxurians FD-317 M1]